MFPTAEAKLSPSKFATTKAEVERLKRERINRWATVSAGVGVAAALATAIGAFSAAVDNGKIANSLGASRWEQASELAASDVAIREQLAALKSEVASLRASGPVSPASAELARLNQAVFDLSKRQKRLEDSISQDPSRALEVPLLRRDVDNMKENQITAIQSMNDRIDEIFDLNKWLLGGGVLSLLSIAFSTLLSRFKTRADS